jgi:hypothetical protein
VAVDDPRPFLPGVVHEPFIAPALSTSGRRQLHAGRPREAEREGVDGVGEAQEEPVGGRMDEDELDRRAALAVEAERAGQAPDGQVDIGVGQDDRRVLGVEAEDAAQAVRLRMLLLEDVRRARGPDEGERRDVTRLDERPGHGASLAVEDVDDALREAVCESAQQRRLAEHPEPGQLRHHRVARSGRRGW